MVMNAGIFIFNFPAGNEEATKIKICSQ